MEKKETLSKEVIATEKKQLGILELKNTVSEIKHPMGSQAERKGQEKESVNWKIEQQKLFNHNKQKINWKKLTKPQGCMGL